jgi:hypothetical protein
MVDRWTNPTTASLRGEDSRPLQQTFSSLSSYLEKLDNAITAAAASGVSSLSAGTGISLSGSTGSVTVSNTGVTNITGTANQISVSAPTGPIVISIPNSPTLSGTLTAGGFYAVGQLTLNRANATGVFAGGNINLQIDGTTQAQIGVTSSRVEINGNVTATGYIQAGSSGITDAGSVSATGWFRSSGGTGWYNQTYGGGIWMQDSTYVRVYGSKIFVAETGITGTAQYGSYGSISLRGTTGGYTGLSNPDTASAFMWTNTVSGHYRNNNTWSYYFENGVLYLTGDGNYRLTYNNNNGGLPWHYGPTLVGYNGWSYYSTARARFEMGHRDNTSSGHIYAWVTGGLILGSSPNDSMAGTATLTIAGSAAKSSGGTTWAIYSDARVKDDIKDYTKGLSEVVALQPKSFVFNGKNNTVAGEKSVGLIAQDVQPIFPDSISVLDLDPLDDIPDPMLFNYNEINFALINAIKELNERIERLENV